MTRLTQEFELFNRLTALDGDERERVLGHAAAADPDMAARVHRLLAFDEHLSKLTGDWPFAPVARPPRAGS